MIRQWWLCVGGRFLRTEPDGTMMFHKYRSFGNLLFWKGGTVICHERNPDDEDNCNPSKER